MWDGTSRRWLRSLFPHRLCCAIQHSSAYLACRRAFEPYSVLAHSRNLSLSMSFSSVLYFDMLVSSQLILSSREEPSASVTVLSCCCVVGWSLSPLLVARSLSWLLFPFLGLFLALVFRLSDAWHVHLVLSFPGMARIDDVHVYILHYVSEQWEVDPLFPPPSNSPCHPHPQWLSLSPSRSPPHDRSEGIRSHPFGAKVWPRRLPRGSFVFPRCHSLWRRKPNALSDPKEGPFPPETTRTEGPRPNPHRSLGQRSR